MVPSGLNRKPRQYEWNRRGPSFISETKNPNMTWTDRYLTRRTQIKEMTNYIIDPQVFYWMDVFGILQTVFAVFGGVLTVAFISLTIGWVYNSLEVKKCYESNLLYQKECKKWAIITGIIGSVLITMSIFIPGKTTSIEMLVAKTATFDNVNWAVQQVKEVVDYIVYALKSVQ